MMVALCGTSVTTFSPTFYSFSSLVASLPTLLGHGLVGKLKLNRMELALGLRSGSRSSSWNFSYSSSSSTTPVNKNSFCGDSL